MLAVRNVYVPPMPSAVAIVVNEAKLVAAGVLSSPISMATSAPGADPNVTVTELSRTWPPMSRIRPVPFFSPPSSGLPR